MLHPTHSSQILPTYAPFLIGAFILTALAAYASGIYLHMLYYGGNLIDDWNSIQFSISYCEHGFVKRGIIGTLFDLLGIPTTQVAMTTFSVTCIAIVILALILLGKQFGNSIAPKQQIRLAFLLALSPATFSHLGFDLGRFDALLFAIFLFGWIAILNQRYLLAGLLSAIAILIHEIFLVVFLPILCAVASWRQLPSWPQAARLLILPLVSGIAVMKFGVFEPGTDALEGSIRDRVSDFDAMNRASVDDALLVWAAGTESSVNKLSDIIWNIYTFKNILVGALPILALLTTLALILVRQSVRPNILVLCGLTPALLFFVGIDFYRWLSFLWITVFCVLILCMIHSRNPTAPSNTEYMAHFALCLLGPLGVMDSLPLLLLLIGK